MAMTERLTDKKLIELAKKQYETTQRSTVPSVLVDLPSKGLVYPESSPLRRGKVEMRYMTAYDEDILTNYSYIRSGVMLDKLLESLIVDPINISDIIPTDFDALIIAARAHGYGPIYTVQVIDPTTKNMLERTIDLSKIKIRDFSLNSNAAGEFEYTAPGIDIKFKYLTKQQMAQITADRSVSDFLKQCITECNAMRNTVDIENFIKYQMTPIESRDFRAYMSKHAPGIILEAEFEGETGGTFTAGFQIGSDFFWI